MRVYVIRHGESESNLAKQWTGWVDVHLTEKGIADAKKAGEFLKDISFDKVYSSDLIRAVETTENAIPGCKYETSMLLREINLGSLAGIPYTDTKSEDLPHIREIGFDKYGGETRAEFRERAKRFIKEKLESLDCENVAVFCHAGWLREMLGIVLDTNVSSRQICCNNCTVSVYDYTDNVWKLYSWNNI